MLRAVLQTDITRDDIDDAAARAGWRLSNIIAGTPQQPAQMIYTTARGDTPLYLVEDGRLDVLYFAAAGDGAADVIARVRSELSCCEAGDHRALMADLADVMRLRRGLGMLVLQLPEPDAEALELFARALRHPDLQVRSLALTAASYALWPALRPSIEQLASADPLPALRATAAQLLLAMSNQP